MILNLILLFNPELELIVNIIFPLDWGCWLTCPALPWSLSTSIDQLIQTSNGSQCRKNDFRRLASQIWASLDIINRCIYLKCILATKTYGWPESVGVQWIQVVISLAPFFLLWENHWIQSWIRRAARIGFYFVLVLINVLTAIYNLNLLLWLLWLKPYFLVIITLTFTIIW
jgi:hypothetical protein